MDQRAIRDLLRQLGELQRRQVRYRQGVVTDDSPLSVALGGSDVSYTGVAALPDTYAIGDPVAVLMFDRDLIVLGVVNGAGGGGGAGTPGSQWHFTTGAPATGLGVVGDFALADDGSVYEKTGVATWTLRDNLTGPTGATGSAGATGATGPAGPAADDQMWLPPTGAIVETIPRYQTTVATAPISGTLLLHGGVTLRTGVTYSSATFFAFGASTTLTHTWACLVRVSDRQILAVSPDNTSASWTTLTTRTFTFGAPYTPAADEPIWVGLLATASSTLPTIASATSLGWASTAAYAPLWHGRSTTGLTTPLGTGTIVAVPTSSSGGPAWCSLA